MRSIYRQALPYPATRRLLDSLGEQTKRIVKQETEAASGSHEWTSAPVTCTGLTCRNEYSQNWHPRQSVAKRGSLLRPLPFTAHQDHLGAEMPSQKAAPLHQSMSDQHTHTKEHGFPDRRICAPRWGKVIQGRGAIAKSAVPSTDETSGAESVRIHCAIQNTAPRFDPLVAQCCKVSHITSCGRATR